MVTKKEGKEYIKLCLRVIKQLEKDKKVLRNEIFITCTSHGIKGLELNALYSEVYGSNQSSGVKEE